MSDACSLSIVIPARNEAGHIVGTLDNVTTAIAGLPIEAEILVVDDGSSDATGGLVDAYARRFPAIRRLENAQPIGLGATCRRGIDAAAGDYVVMVPGDNAWGAATLRTLFSHVGDADIIVGYTRDMWRSRPLARTVVSKAFTLVVNLITGRHLRYYNGLQIHRAAVLKGLVIDSAGCGFRAEVLVRALGLARTFIEVPMTPGAPEQAFRPGNVIDVVRTLRRIRAMTPRAAAR